MTLQPPRTVDLFVNGRWQPPQAGRYEPATSPVTGELIGQVAQGDRADAAAAVQAATAGLGRWASATAFERARALHRVVLLMPAFEAAAGRAGPGAHPRPGQAAARRGLPGSRWRPDRLLARRGRGRAAPGWRDPALADSPGARVLIERRPLGVVAVITPWNWLRHTMPAAGHRAGSTLAAGNITVVWTPAPTTSVCSAVLMDAIADADVPPGTVAFLPGPGPVVGDEIAGHPGVAAVAFVGSTQTGLSVARRAAGKAQLLEMGNNGPLVVMDDADLDRAVAGTLVGAYLCAGQSCTAAERVLVHERIHDAFVGSAGRRGRQGGRAGRPVRPADHHGVSAEQRRRRRQDRLATWPTRLARGADLIAGMRRRGRPGGRRPFTGSPPCSTTSSPGTSVVAREVMILRAGHRAGSSRSPSLQDAITLTDDLPYGLMAAIYTADAGTGLRYADAVRAAWVNVNESSNYWETHLPFGGGGGSASGVGRVGGRYAMEALSQVRTVVLSGLV